RTAFSDLFLSSFSNLNRSHFSDLNISYTHESFHYLRIFNGSRMKNLVPVVDLILIDILPPILSTVCFTNARPKPVPELLVVKLGSKIRSCTAWSIPRPES